MSFPMVTIHISTPKSIFFEKEIRIEFENLIKLQLKSKEQSWRFKEQNFFLQHLFRFFKEGNINRKSNSRVDKKS